MAELSEEQLNEIWVTIQELMGLEVMEELAQEALKQALFDSVTGATSNEILDIARNQAGELITSINQGTLDGLREILKSGLEEQIDVATMARRIKNEIGLNAKQVSALNNERKRLKELGLSDAEIENKISKLTTQKIKERAELIANTEIRYSVSKAEDEIMKARGAIFKKSISSHDDKVSDICRNNEAQGVIPINQAFSSGSLYTPFHPQCRCSVSYFSSQDAADRAQERTDSIINTY